MKVATVAGLSLAGALLASVAVYAVTASSTTVAERRAAASAKARAAASATGSAAPAQPPPAARVRAGSTVLVDARLGHARLAGEETFLLLEARGSDLSSKHRVPVSMAVVIDRSGSMAGSRLENAVKAATGVVDRLADGDFVSVVTFDTRTELVVPPTALNASTRMQISAALRSIEIGGDTCISCGIVQALSALAQITGRVSQLLVLSDGQATAGVRDAAGFKSIAANARGRDVAISTIGVGLNYNEENLVALARGSNGRHYFVEDDASLSRVFEAEARAARATVANRATVAVTLQPGVELLEVLSRGDHRLDGQRVLVALGSLSGGETRTVLLRLRVSRAAPGSTVVGAFDLRFNDLVTENAEAAVSGRLALERTGGDSSPLDPLVDMCVEQTRTAGVLRLANELFKTGQADQARQRLQAQLDALKRRTYAQTLIGVERGPEIVADFQRQRGELQNALAKLTPQRGKPQWAPQSPEGRRWVRQNAYKASPF